MKNLILILFMAIVVTACEQKEQYAKISVNNNYDYGQAKLAIP